MKLSPRMREGAIMTTGALPSTPLAPPGSAYRHAGSGSQQNRQNEALMNLVPGQGSDHDEQLHQALLNPVLGQGLEEKMISTRLC